MIIGIEYWKHNKDVLLIGGSKTAFELKRCFEEVESIYDRDTDNYVELFCRMFNYEIIESDEIPEYIFDRDIMRVYKPRS